MRKSGGGVNLKLSLTIQTISELLLTKEILLFFFSNHIRFQRFQKMGYNFENCVTMPKNIEDFLAILGERVQEVIATDLSESILMLS